MADGPEEIGRRVDTVVDMDRRGDYEEAHAFQDGIYEDVLRAVANGHPDAQDMAAEALRMIETGGTRQYA